jgi:cyclophilin family peptidyl-prolyl cis-trans isomerase
MNMLITVVLPALLLMMAASCDQPKPPAGGGTPQDAKSRPTTGPTPATPGKADFPVVKIETTEGSITVELDRKKAPITVENFLSYARKGFYDGTVFHRVIKTFMIQGGGMTEDGRQKQVDKPINNEASNGLRNLRGTIAMGQIPGNQHSADSQFFINVVDNAFLDYGSAQSAKGYCVFGKVKDDASMKAVDAIRDTPVRGETPVKAPKVTKVTIVSE